MSLTHAAVIVCLLALAYIFVGYPFIIAVLARARPRPVKRKPCALSVTVLIPAHNEGAVIREKILNVASAEYPGELMEVIVLSDGSTDDTVEVAHRTIEEMGRHGSEVPQVRLFNLPRLGKARTLDAGANAAQGEILVFTDANVEWQTDALRRLVENFADGWVGGVCGEKRHRPTAGPTGRGEGLYWRYENALKRMESELGSTVAADGALYAIRRHLYVPIDNPASADDMAISMRVVLQGYRLVCEPRAVAIESAPEDTLGEFGRKVRITNHSMRALLSLGPQLLTSGLYSFQLVSHKLLRHLSPLFLASLAAATLAAVVLDPAPWIWGLLLGQLAFWGLAFLGHALRKRSLASSGPVAATHHFALMQGAALAGLGSLLRGDRPVAWQPRGGLEAA